MHSLSNAVLTEPDKQFPVAVNFFCVTQISEGPLMRNGLMLVAAFLVFASGTAQAYNCDPTYYCDDYCQREAKQIKIADRNLQQLQSLYNTVRNRRDRLQAEMDRELEAFDKKADFLFCKVTQIQDAGQAELAAFLASAANVECTETCPRYLSLYAQVDRRICKARASYDRFVSRRNALESRWQLRVDRYNQRLAEVAARLATAEAQLVWARDRFRSCTARSCGCGCSESDWAAYFGFTVWWQTSL